MNLLDEFVVRLEKRISEKVTKWRCKRGLHEWEYHSGGALTKKTAYYGEKCKHCGEGNVTYFGPAYNRRFKQRNRNWPF